VDPASQSTAFLTALKQALFVARTMAIIPAAGHFWITDPLDPRQLRRRCRAKSIAVACSLIRMIGVRNATIEDRWPAGENDRLSPPAATCRRKFAS
jgi:hypothetical protein